MLGAFLKDVSSFVTYIFFSFLCVSSCGVISRCVGVTDLFRKLNFGLCFEDNDDLFFDNIKQSSYPEL